MQGKGKGRIVTDATKAKISAGMKGKRKGRIVTAATRQKMSAGMKGKGKGRIVTAATRQKMSDAKKKMWEKRREEKRVKYKGPGGSMSEETNTPVDSEVVLIKKEPCSDHNADSDLNVTGSSKFNREINNTLPILQNPADETQSLLFESEGEIALMKVSEWGFLKSYLDGLAQPQIKNIKSKIKKSMCEWITLNEKNRMEYTKRLDEIYEITTPIEIGPDRGRSAFAKREIKKFEVLGPYAGTLCKNKDLSQAERKQGPRKISEYLFATSSSHRAINGFSSGNVLSLVNTAQLGNFKKIGENNICVVLFGKNINFYVANKDIHKGEEFLVNYGPLYASEIKKEPQEMDLNG